MILEQTIGDAILNITRNGKIITLKIGDTFTDDEYMSRTVYGTSGKVIIRVDPNCTVEIGAVPAPVEELATPTAKPIAKSTPVVDETPTE
jgi:hypothetical protein